MKAKKNSAKKVAKPVAAKKPAAKPVKKPVAKVVAKKPAVKAKTASPASKAKPLAAKKPVAKPSKPVAKASSGFSIKAAAAKLKSALTTKKKPEPKPVKKAVAPVAAKKQPAPAPVKKAAPAPAKAVAKPVPAPTPVPTAKAVVRPVVATPVKAKPKLGSKTPSNYVSPKGVLTEGQIRRSHERDYMSDSQLDFFRHRLLQMRNEVLERELDVKERLHQREVFADPADRATAEEEHWLDLRLRERESLLLHKIDDALRRIAEREFGYCEKTGDAIGIPRLLARPTATVCVDVKGQDERIESQFRDR